MKRLLVFLFSIISGSVISQNINYPFPNHTDYTSDHIKPNNYTQTQLNDHARSFYDQLKIRYLKNDCGNNTEYYVFSGGGAKNVSEAQGYGMMITVYFAGHVV